MAPLKNVIIVGAGGNLGTMIITALKADPVFEISVLSRKSSTSTFPPSFKVHTVGDDYPEEELVEAFRGKDAVISAMTMIGYQQQYVMIDAAVKAGVKRFFPAEFGSDTDHLKARELVPLFQEKKNIVEYLVAKEETGLTWTGIMTGIFWELCLKTSFIGFDLSGHKATIWDSGDSKWSATTHATVGLAVRKVLLRPEDTANKYLYVASFTVSQNEVLASLQKNTGKKWTLTHVKSEDQIKIGAEKLAKGDFSGIVPLITANVYREDSGSNFVRDHGLANHLLGLPMENLDDAVAALSQN